jgi:hypothetical protein
VGGGSGSGRGVEGLERRALTRTRTRTRTVYVERRSETAAAARSGKIVQQNRCASATTARRLARLVCIPTTQQMTMERGVNCGAWFDWGVAVLIATVMNAKLKLCLAQTGRRQYQIAREVGLTENELSRIVRGRRAATADERRRLALVLGVAEPELFGV